MSKTKKVLKSISVRPPLAYLAYKVIPMFFLVSVSIWFSFYSGSNHKKSEKSSEILVGENSDSQQNPEYDTANFKINIEQIKIKAPIIFGVDPSDEKNIIKR
jgi:hypothetical protein